MWLCLMNKRVCNFVDRVTSHDIDSLSKGEMNLTADY